MRNGSGPEDCNCYKFRRWLNGGAQVASYQDEVGTWHEFIKGYICRRWSEQHAFFTERDGSIQDTRELLMAALIGFLWQWSHHMKQKERGDAQG
jgi:hypothetical protein